MSRSRPPRPPERPPASPGPSDEELWARAVADVEPLAGRPAAPPKAPPRDRPRAAPDAPPDGRGFAELLEATGGFDVDERGEAVRGRAPDLPVATLRRLASGGFPVDERLDLHGRTVADAERLVPAVVAGARARGARVVLLVHGRSGGAPGRASVLRRFVHDWSASPAARAHVLAFATATPRDGGAGALYLLLKR